MKSVYIYTHTHIHTLMYVSIYIYIYERRAFRVYLTIPSPVQKGKQFN